MIERRYESTLPITNRELYDIIDNIPEEELGGFGLSYFGKDCFNDIVLQYEGDGTQNSIYFSHDENRPQIIIDRDISRSVSTFDRKCRSIKVHLTRLLEMDLREVCQDQEVPA